MKKDIIDRLDELISLGSQIAREGESYYVGNLPQAQAWFVSVGNAVSRITPTNSYYREELKRIGTHPHLADGMPINVAQQVQGLLNSVRVEAENGLLQSIESQAFATAFDDFLDHATEFHKSGKVKEAAILASAVLEDTVKRIALKSNLDVAGVSLDKLIDNLVKAETFTAIKAKRVKSYASVRNSAFHAEYEKFDLKDVASMIEGIRELLDTFL